MVDGSRLDYKLLAQPYTPDKDEMIAVLHPVWPTADLADIAHRVNIKDKFAGRCVWDSTKGQPVWADGPLASDTWSLSTGVVASTPA